MRLNVLKTGISNLGLQRITEILPIDSNVVKVKIFHPVNTGFVGSEITYYLKKGDIFLVKNVLFHSVGIYFYKSWDEVKREWDKIKITNHLGELTAADYIAELVSFTYNEIVLKCDYYKG